MKRIAAVLLTVLMVLSAFSCGQKPESGNETGKKEETESAAEETKYTPAFNQATVVNPMTEWPCYKLSENATPDEMRATVVRAMHDFLAVKWTPTEQFTYSKTGSGDNYDFVFYPIGVYQGIPYTNADAGLFQWLACMDCEKGILYDANFIDINQTQGATCSTTVFLGTMAACNSVKVPQLTYGLVPKNGFLPLGDYIFPMDIKSYNDYPTDQIVKDNGLEAIYEAYALVKPADALVSTGSDDTDNHAIMAIENAEVSRNGDGTIDPKHSIIVIQDQRFVRKEEEADGQKVTNWGRLRAELTFEYLARLNYIPMTTAEFQGWAPYTVAEAKLNKEPATIKDLQGATVLSNYVVSVGYARIYDESGRLLGETKKLTNGNDARSGAAMNFKVSGVLTKSALESTCEKGKNYRAEVEVVLTNGERFTVADLDFTYE